MGSWEDSYGMGSPSWMGGWFLCPRPGAGAVTLDQALISLAEGLLQVQLGFGAAALRPPLLGEHEGSLLPRLALGGTTAAMPRACLAAWAGAALLTGLVPVRCIPADIPSREGFCRG